jgi:UDP-N-acetylmuramyl tripeptide synthase
MLTILLCKIAAFFGKLLGRGSSLPGSIALKLNKRILGRLKMPGIVVAVTGSNGKTSTAELIRTAAEAAGKRVVCNTEGSNQIEGVATTLLKNCGLNKKVKADVAVLECDERFCQHIFKYFSPTHIVVTNLFCDQMTRNGNSAFVAGELKKGLPEDSVLIINADDPVSAALAFSRGNAVYFSVEAAQLHEDENTVHACDDGGFCPVCGARMTYGWRLQNHLGSYNCPSCGFGRKKPAHAVTSEDNGEFVLDGGIKIKPQMPNMFFAYNIAAAYTVALEVFGMRPEAAAGALTGHTLSNDFINRVMKFTIGRHSGTFLLSKHENIISYNGSIRTILDADSDNITVVIIVDLLSRKYVANDMSWLWDIDFELLRDRKIKKIVVGGRFANDVAARLLFAGIEDEKTDVFISLDDMMPHLAGNASGDIYLLTCFTDIGKFKSGLKGGMAQ